MMTESEAKRFWSKVAVTGGCWEWCASKDRDGYGFFSLPPRATPRKTFYAHRLAYESAWGAIPSGFQIDHLCRNKGCVNPAHLEAVTQQENIRRQQEAGGTGAYKTHCPAGHEYTPENTVIKRRSDTVVGFSRRCRACYSAGGRRSRSSSRAAA